MLSATAYAGFYRMFRISGPCTNSVARKNYRVAIFGERNKQDNLVIFATTTRDLHINISIGNMLVMRAIRKERNTAGVD
jgi:hypothetical protein